MSKYYWIPAAYMDFPSNNLPEEPFTEDSWGIWTGKIKYSTGLSGKNLYQPLRQILTGMNNGPELKYLLPLLNKRILLKKLGKL